MNQVNLFCYYVCFISIYFDIELYYAAQIDLKLSFA